MSRMGAGIVDQMCNISFSFDGKTYQAKQGDTLASALLRNGVQLVGRSFKYHRPRGVFSDGIEEPNALVTLGEGAHQTPNIRATEQEVFDGLIARSQNRFPSLNFDILSVNNILSPFIGAGFYYKTFMWPKRFWEWVYEPFIRRAAGLGALSGKEDRQDYLRGFLFCDVLVMGSGLAGLQSALIAGQAGADVILVEGDFELGGRLIRDQGAIDGMSYLEFRDDIIAKLRALENVLIMPRTYVTGAYDGGVYGALERLSDHKDSPDSPRQCFWRIMAREAINAGGAVERPIAFQNNDLPGIMLAGAVRAYANRFGVLVGRRIAVFTNNSDGWKTAHDLSTAGAEVVAVIDARQNLEARDEFPVYSECGVKKANGYRSIKSITLTNGDTIPCDLLAVSGGWNPNVHLHCHHGGRPIWDDEAQCFVPKAGMIKSLHPVGAANGVFSDAVILSEVKSVTMQVLKSLQFKSKPIKLPKALDDPMSISSALQVEGQGCAWLDFQNDVTVKDVKQAYRENFRSVEHMKRYTTLGMATDQGKTANVNALGVMAELAGTHIPDMGTTTFRSPLTPIPIAAMGAGGAGKTFQPIRELPSHGFCKARKAPMIEVGLWMRPSYFPHSGEKNWRQSCDREVGYVRNAVGVTDVSTLGKIILRGEGAAEILDLVYTGKMSTLNIERVRYGLMLREDGMVMDDGTCARLDTHEYLITTTTAAAGEVMLHLEFAHQCLMPHLDLNMVSVTDHFAQFAVAGPRSRKLLESLVDVDISNESLPFMGLLNCEIGGVDGRIFRISFSGELGFEIAVPRRYGDALFRELVARAESMDGGVYGMEALNVLRIEKGFITHSEIHGRVTAYDLGMEKMISPSKDCIGKVMAARVGLVGVHRQQFVGLKPIGAVKKMLAGSIAIELDCEATRENIKGYLTSTCYSPTIGSMIGLGFIENGRARMGEKIRLVDLVRDFDTLCEICDPVFFDPEGERQRG